MVGKCFTSILLSSPFFPFPSFSSFPTRHSKSTPSLPLISQPLRLPPHFLNRQKKKKLNLYQNLPKIKRRTSPS